MVKKYPSRDRRLTLGYGNNGIIIGIKKTNITDYFYPIPDHILITFIANLQLILLLALVFRGLSLDNTPYIN